MGSIANITEVLRLAKFLKESIPRYAETIHDRGAWTTAIHFALREFANDRGWDLYPTDRPYKGEFLLDFMVIQRGYGIRIACEAEWWPDYPQRSADLQLAELDTDFEKLTAVKGDIKLFIYEGEDAHLNILANKYLAANAQITSDEAFLAMQWTKHGDFACFWWKPLHDEFASTVRFETL